ncbi:serine/threonine-protein kinase [Streptomyces albipurpureus]|uniref:non-specific serine/threonine protein kinase n=1 Tax=Streptomyces albipurpureus TaxID=2897419 RepID=A0ABT0UKP3_9ACTN|nr:serine/threonine-protein kinase [Streptomyces sp. CWNU-1]MCM2389187.1 protein kinase [Streptomyces sp. CWNU-1]
MTDSRALLKPLSGDDPQRLGPYWLLGRLGAGGMGRVYLARSTTDTRLLAVKCLLTEGSISDTDRRRFAREIILARRIDSRHTAKVRGADPEAERPWMAIDYIPAPSLAELVRTGGVLPSVAVRWIAAGTAAALFTLHQADIIHRDVKPQNILLPMSGARVIDFGISHATDLTRTPGTFGTFHFVAPEQADGMLSTAASDIYSFGATLFHLAVGRPLYPEGDDAFQLLAKIRCGDTDTTGLPADLKDVVHRCLALDPRDRPGAAELLVEFATELAAPAASQAGQHWLPAKWARLLAEYEEHGAALAAAVRTASPAAPPAPAQLQELLAVSRAAQRSAQLRRPRTLPSPSPPTRARAASPAPTGPAGRPASPRHAKAPVVSPDPAVPLTPVVPPVAPALPAAGPAIQQEAPGSTAPTGVLPQPAEARTTAGPDPAGESGPVTADPGQGTSQGTSQGGPNHQGRTDRPERQDAADRVPGADHPSRLDQMVRQRQPLVRHVIHRYPAPPAEPIRIYPAQPVARRGQSDARTRWLIGCGIVLLLVIIGFVASPASSHDRGGGGGQRDSDKGTAVPRIGMISAAGHTAVGDCLGSATASAGVVPCDSATARWRVTATRTERYDGLPAADCPTGPDRQSAELVDTARMRTLLCLRLL